MGRKICFAVALKITETHKVVETVCLVITSHETIEDFHSEKIKTLHSGYCKYIRMIYLNKENS